MLEAVTCAYFGNVPAALSGAQCSAAFMIKHLFSSDRQVSRLRCSSSYSPRKFHGRLHEPAVFYPLVDSVQG